MSVQKFNVPISIKSGSKNYYLNLNSYRNWHYHLSSSLKREFRQLVQEDVRKLKPVEGKCKIAYSIYYPTKRAFDIDNIGSVVTKFTCDALVEFGILEDDNYAFVNELNFSFGGVDSKNPRCEVTIEEI